MDVATLKARSSINRTIRAFFSSEGYTEVETPILSPGVIPESPIEIFETFHYRAGGGGRPLYLLPSPELYMKKLIAEGSGDIFQIVRSFRNGEESGPMHHPEFTMLEWYRVGADYHDSIGTAERLFSSLADAAPFSPAAGSSAAERPGAPETSSAAEKLRPPFRTMSVREAVQRYAGVDLLQHQSRMSLAAEVEKLGLAGAAAPNPAQRDRGPERNGGPEESETKPDSWEELFNRLLITFVEPNLPADRPTVLYDYPAQIPALAKQKDSGPWLERWELYLGSVELANCYSEETDPERIRAFFRKEYAEKASLSSVVPDVDEEFISLFDDSEAPFPRCSGTALGVDRLVMMLTGKSSLEGVILFPFSDILSR